MSRFLVTGGAGFIGSHLVDRLIEEGHEIVVLDDLSSGKMENIHPSAFFAHGKVEDEAYVEDILSSYRFKFDGVFHLAAIASVTRSNEEWSLTHRVNQTGTINILNAVRKSKIPVVYASSAAIYGNQDQIVHENLRPAPQTAYGADKLGSEQHAYVGWNIHQIPSVGFRFMNVYGPRQDPSSPYSGVISIFTKKISEGQPISVFGNGQQTRDFVFVGDVVNHLIAGMKLLQETPQYQVLNVATQTPTTIWDLAKEIGNIERKEVQIAFQPARKGDIAFSQGSNALAKSILGVEANVSLYDGLSITLGKKSWPSRILDINNPPDYIISDASSFPVL